ncbi:Elongation of fatty acids protein 2 [Quaeritorhiza haematococci]|nr:Elongation of fatty acids protein 2 [Quaeritorhiza haematococci]
MVENGIKPVYVFDGKPPDMKSAEVVQNRLVSELAIHSDVFIYVKLKKRGERREEAQKSAEAATEAGDTANFDKFSRRTVKVTKEHNDECRRLLSLMGIPYVDAPCEAEAQCAALAKAGKVYGAGSEDMDTMTFGAPVLLRHLTFSEARKLPIIEMHLPSALEGLEMTMDQFIDLCILLGCDYCDSIRGIGPKSAVNLIKEHGTLEKVLASLDKKKYNVPENWPYQQARELFKNPDVLDPETVDLKWGEPDEEGIVAFLVGEKNFNEKRVRDAVKKLTKSRSVATQGRLDGFFKVLPKDETKKAVNPAKRKADEKPAGKTAAKKKATGGGKKPRR